MELTQLAEAYGVNLATTASIVTLILVLIATLKKHIPQLQGTYTVIASLVLAVLGGVATAYDKGVVAVIVAAIIIFVGTTGAWEIIKKAGGGEQ